MTTDQDTLNEITKRLVGETLIYEETSHHGSMTEFRVRRSDGQKQAFPYRGNLSSRERAEAACKAREWANEAPGVVTMTYFGAGQDEPRS